MLPLYAYIHKTNKVPSELTKLDESNKIYHDHGQTFSRDDGTKGFMINAFILNLKGVKAKHLLGY